VDHLRVQAEVHPKQVLLEQQVAAVQVMLQAMAEQAATDSLLAVAVAVHHHWAAQAVLLALMQVVFLIAVELIHQVQAVLVIYRLAQMHFLAVTVETVVPAVAVQAVHHRVRVRKVVPVEMVALFFTIRSNYENQ
jgi:hypothetical protein